MGLKSFLSLCPPDFEIVLADVGAAGGIKDRWAPARAVVAAMLFEPRDGGEPRRRGRDMLYPVALGDAPGRAVLNVTALPNMSSTLLPNAALLESFRKKGAHTSVLNTVEMPVDTLDAIVARDAKRVDAIKVDTQGSELAILKGAHACLSSSVIVAEVEVSFLERYQGQPLFSDIESFMNGLGFVFHDFYRLKRYRAVNRAGLGNVSLGSGQRAGRLAYGDALFLLSEDRLLERVRAEGETLALKIIIALLVYGKADLAARFFDLSADRFGAERRARIARELRGFKGLRHSQFHHVIDYLARHV